jgi:hypothetical protein
MQHGATLKIKLKHKLKREQKILPGIGQKLWTSGSTDGIHGKTRQAIHL